MFSKFSKEAMTLPTKVLWKAAPDKVQSLKKNNVHTLIAGTSVPSGYKIIGSRWVFKIKADNSKKTRIDLLEREQVPGHGCCGVFAQACRL